MLKRTANKIIKELEKTNTINSITYNSAVSNYLVLYLDGDFKKKQIAKLKEVVNEFSNKKVSINFDYPQMLCISGKDVKNRSLITLALRLLQNP
jgi:hypothetical protein